MSKNNNQRCMFGFGEKGVRQCRNKVITDTEFCKVHAYLIDRDGGADDDEDEEISEKNNTDDGIKDKEKEFQERIRKAHEMARMKGKVGWRRYGNRVEQLTEDQDKQEVSF